MTAADAAAAQPAKRRKKREAPQNLSGLLDCMRDLAKSPEAEDGVSIDELMGAVGRRSYGPLLLVIGLFSISPATAVPGMTWFAALLTLLVAGQMALGAKRLWLPNAARNVNIKREHLEAGVEKARPWAQRIDKLLRPRLEFLTNPPWVNIIALMCVGAAIITVPLGFIPFAPVAPGLAIVLFGLGMAAKDGLLLALGGAAVGGAGYLLYWFFG